ncbi:hypothetical protein [Adhaeribacter pallidiroseus]|nr:hypothetical protein [Adhaeribacter pallidiroseus]
MADGKVIKDSHTQFVVFKYLQLNINEYSEFLRELSNVPVTNIDIKIITDNVLIMEANRIVLNLLSSFKFFLDNAQTFLKRKYGKNSKIVNDFIDLTKQHYDASFAYRFLSKLRNYSLHLGFPIDGLHFQAEPNNKNPEKMIGDFAILINIETMLNEKDLFGSVYKELLELQEDIDIRPLIKDLSISIIDIQKFIYKIQQEELEEAISNIETFAGEFKTSENDITVFSDYAESDNVINFKVYTLPFDLIEDFNTYRKSLK